MEQMKGYTLMNKRFILNILVLLFGFSALTAKPNVQRANGQRANVQRTNVQRVDAQRVDAQRNNARDAQAPAHTQKGTASKPQRNDANTNEQIEDPTLEESWSKFLRLKWTSLSGHDMWNIGATVVTCGAILYLCKHLPKSSAGGNVARPPHDNDQGPDNANNHHIRKPKTDNNNPLNNNKERTCDICFEDKKEHEFYTLSCCDHKASCKECLIERINGPLQEKTTAGIQCTNINGNCVQPISERDVRDITHRERPEVYQAFLAVSTQEWLDKNTKNCPTPDCKYTFIDNQGHRQSFKCPQCSQTYCSDCLTRHPVDKTCEQAEKDRKLAGNKTAAARADEEWKKDHSKKCPQCKANIEKNEGCNHMTCKCGHGFCWICLARWKTCNCPQFPPAPPINWNNINNPTNGQGQQGPQPFQWNADDFFNNFMGNRANNAQQNNQRNVNNPPQNINNNRNNANNANRNRPAAGR